jgi:hypothetical protein
MCFADIFFSGIAPGRFELPSTGPEPAMLGHYTTGLFCAGINLAAPESNAIYLFFAAKLKKKC